MCPETQEDLVRVGNEVLDFYKIQGKIEKIVCFYLNYLTNGYSIKNTPRSYKVQYSFIKMKGLLAGASLSDCIIYLKNSIL